MCTLKVIVKDQNNNIISDERIDIGDTIVNPIDRPSYAEFKKGEISKTTFIFSDDNEKNLDVITSNITATFGSVSGRIKSFEIVKDQVNETDKYQLLCKAKENNRGIRFTNNLNGYIDIVKTILSQYLKE